MQYVKNALIKKLEEHRLRNKITLKELAESLDVNYTTTYRWFSGKANPNKIQTFHIKRLLKEPHGS